VLRVGRLSADGFDPLLGGGGPVARAHSVAEYGQAWSVRSGIPAGANVSWVRNAPQLFGMGAIDAIPDEAIRAGTAASGGRVNVGTDGRPGRFGWKADIVSLRQFVADAFRTEMGLTNPLTPRDLADGCGSARLDLDLGTVEAVTAYVRGLAAPAPVGASGSIFDRIGCAACHTPDLAGVPLYSDLLLHDMGRALDDGIVQGDARGQDWRTTPLWGLQQRLRFLHDGRADSIEAAILAHGGEAESAAQQFRALAPEDRVALLSFLGRL
jgi:CxxC motif-containing protein (DUF1111 family)